MGEISTKRPLWTTILKEAILNCKVTIPMKKKMGEISKKKDLYGLQF